MVFQIIRLKLILMGLENEGLNIFCIDLSYY